MFGRLLEKRRNLQLADINLVVTGSFAMLSLGVFVVGAILADLIFSGQLRHVQGFSLVLYLILKCYLLKYYYSYSGTFLLQ